jgi:diguanylate cyclase (GGDEF)-like protein
MFEDVKIMWNILRRAITAPTFADKEQTHAARWLNRLALTLIVLLSMNSLLVLIGILDQDALAQILLANVLGLALNIGSLFLMRRGQVKLAALILCIILFALFTYMNAFVFHSIRTPNIMAYFALIPLAGLLLGRRNMNLVAVLCIATISVIFTLEWTRLIVPAPNTRSIVDDLFVLFLTIVMNTILLNASIRRVEENAEEVQQAAEAVAAANQELQVSQVQLQQARDKLEDRVQQRTNELQQTNLQLQAEIEVRKRAEEQLAHDALHDALTGLPNRVLFMDRLRHALTLAKRNQTYRFSVLFLDFDHFKVVNDSLGHTVGDQLLIAIAQRLGLCLRMGDTVARLGGDEFVILLEDPENGYDITSVANHLQQELKQSFVLERHEVFTSASIGIVANSSRYDEPEEILRDADIAMYRAKALGKARCETFTVDMREQVVTRLELENDLRNALERRELQLYYQPIVDLQSDQISGFEALLRWRHPQRGFVSPAEFVPLAEETGLILPIGLWVLTEACQQIHAWQTRFPQKPPLTMSVNISAKQFSAPGFIRQIETILQQICLAGNTLKLEITEGVYLNRSEEMIAIFNKLHSLGIQFHIDDFGTGYSSLSYLQHFPFQTIKIDQAFVSRMDSQGNNKDIVRTIIALAHDLGMNTVAEGIETVEQLNHLKELGCNYGQGYFLSRPVDREGAEKLLTAPMFSLAVQPKAMALHRNGKTHH